MQMREDRLRTLVIGLAAIGLLITTVAFRRADVRSSAVEKLSASAGVARSASSTQSQPAVERRQLVRVFVHSDDIYPSLVAVEPGKILLVAENETHSDISLVVEKSSAGQSRQRVTKLAAAERNKRNRQELTLGVGEYVFYEESNPTVVGKLIVEPK